MMNAVRTVIKIAGYGIVAVVILALTAVIALQTGVVKEKVRVFLVRQVNQAINGQLAIAGVQGNFVTTVSIVGIELRAGQGIIARVARVDMDYFLPALLTGTVDVRRIVISEPNINLVQHGDGTWNSGEIARRSAREENGGQRGALPFSFLRIAKIEIARGTITIMPSGAQRHAGVPTVVSQLFLSGSARMIPADPGDASFSLERSSFQVSNPTVLVSDFGFSGRFHHHTLSIRGGRLTTPNSTVRMEGAVTIGDAPSADILLNAPAIGFEDIRAFFPSVTRSGSLSLEVTARGPLEELRVANRIMYGALLIENNGTIDVRRPAARIHSTVRNLMPEKIMPGRGIKGNLSLDADILVRDARPERLYAAVNVAISSSSLAGSPIERGVIEGLFDRGYLDVVMELAIPSLGTVTAKGKGYAGWGADEAGKKVDITFDAGVQRLNLAEILNQKQWASDLSARARVKITKEEGEKPVYGGRLEIPPSSLGDVKVRDSRISVEYREGRITVAECVIASDKFKVLLDGNADLRGSLDLTCAITVDDLGFIGPWLQEEAPGGALTVSGTLQGTRRYPSLAVKLSGENIRYKTLGIGHAEMQMSARATGRYPEGNIAVKASGASVGNMSLETLLFSAAASSDTFAFAADISREPDKSYAFSGELRGINSERMDLALDRFRISAGTVTWENDETIRAEIAAKRVAVRSFELSSREQHVSLSGQAGISGPLEGTLRLRRVDLNDVRRIADIDFPLNGKLNSEISLKGTALSPVVSGQVTVDGAGIGGLYFDKMLLGLRYAPGSLRTHLALDRKEKPILVAEGAIPLHLTIAPVKIRYLPSGALFEVRGTAIDLSVLTILGRDIEKAGGSLSFALQGTGTLLNPSVKGDIVIRDGTLKILNATGEYRDIRGVFIVRDDRVTIDTLSLQGGDGRAEVSGFVQVRNFMPVDSDVTLTCRNFKAAESDIFTGTLDADLRLRGPVNDNYLSGAVTVRESTVNIPRETRRQIPEIEIVATRGGTTKEVVKVGKKAGFPLIDRLSVDADIELPGRSWVKGSGIDTEIEGSVSLKKDREGPVIVTGNITTVRGTYSFRDRLFTIEEGSVLFTGSRKLDAELNMRATSKVSDLTVIVLLGGTILRPEISLQSDPPRGESEIISYLLFGRPSANLSESEGIMVQRTSSRLLGTLAAKGLSDVLGKDLAPDVLTVRPEGGVGVGKYLSSKLFVKYEWKFGIEEASQTILDYQISKNFSLYSQIGNEKTSGAMLLWNVHY